MKKIVILFISLLASFCADAGRLEAGKGTFLLDGDPFIVKAAELHYPRIPKPYWEHRIDMCKALGMNTICLYVFWNSHEQQEGVFDFEGQNDLREFIKLCGQKDMKVILRPGPYVCAEWEMGGLPWWLLKKEDIRLRENDSYFLERVNEFQKAVATQTADLTVTNGGPIIMVQVENEYGAYGTDKEYVANIRDMLRRNFGEDVTLFQCDWSSNFTENGIDDLLWTLNFGTGADIDGQFARLKELRPDSPLMCSEFWSGWFDKWGANHETRPAEQMIAGIDDMLSRGISFSLYMTHGGTNWGHWAGANSPGFAPDVTSYDYDAPISENGAATQKYYLLRELLQKYSNKRLPAVPDPIPTISIAPFSLSEVAPLRENLPEAFSDSIPRNMEAYDMGFGTILYSTELPPLAGPARMTLDAHDFAQIFLDGKHIGTLDRRLGEKQLTLPATTKDTHLDILVEAMGRINFGRAVKDFKGIVGPVVITCGETQIPLSSWQISKIEDRKGLYDSFNYQCFNDIAKQENGRYPAGTYRGIFNVEKPADTFLNFEEWGKGFVYVNGHPLGRIWEIGPQQTLYMPGCWLREGGNEILIFDILGPKSLTVEGLSEPILDKVNLRPNRPETSFSIDDCTTVFESAFGETDGWQTLNFPTAVEANSVCLEVLDTIDGSDAASIAELYLLDASGNRIPREQWRVLYVSSEDLSGNHTAEKSFDLQETTYWLTDSADKLPHTMVIDLGGNHSLSAIQYLPAKSYGAPGQLNHFRIKVR